MIVTRRHVLAGVAGVATVLAGCTTGAPRQPTPAPRDPLADLLDEHLALAAAYARAIPAHPEDPRLAGLADNATGHIDALAGALATAPPPTTAAEAPTTTPGAGPAGLLLELRERETALADRCSQLALTESARRAPLLASIATAHRCAATVLE